MTSPSSSSAPGPRETIRLVPPRVSVIIATYNWSSVLPYSIGSVLRQTMQDFEILVVGDGCTDDSEQVVAAIRDPRIRWFNLPANTRHQSGPNNEGLRQARGEFIAYLGHDDLWLPHHLESLVSALDASGAGMAHSLVAGAETNGDVVVLTSHPNSGGWLPPSCTAHRRSVTDAVGGWGDYRELRVVPDLDLWRRAREAGFRFAFAPRLTVIKFAASERPGVYRSRPNHEQAAWTARLTSEPNLEATLLAQLVAGGGQLTRMPYRQLVRLFFSETAARIRQRLGQRAFFGSIRRAKGATIGNVRRFKGL
jgi:glycosyltransferase involved in cell wall biosynthesis